MTTFDDRTRSRVGNICEKNGNFFSILPDLKISISKHQLNNKHNIQPLNKARSSPRKPCCMETGLHLQEEGQSSNSTNAHGRKDPDRSSDNRGDPVIVGRESTTGGNGAFGSLA